MAGGRTLRPSGGGFGIGRPLPGTLAIIVACTASYVIWLSGLRLEIPWMWDLALVPQDTVRGKLWQPLTSLLLHAPSRPTHLLFNMLMLWIFGNQMEALLGRRDYLFTCLWSGLGGALMTIVVGGILHAIIGPTSDWGRIWLAPTVGASGMVMGIIMLWAGINWTRRIQLLFLGEMTGRTAGLIFIGIELLTALSFSEDSWTSHLGGAAVGYAVGRGYFKPRFWKKAAARRKHRKTQQRLRRFEVIEGGRDDTAGPPIWGPGAKDDKGPTIH